MSSERERQPAFRRQAGFTLVELLVVTAIISVLAALLLPALEKTLAQGRSIQCRNNQKQIGLLYVTYADDYGDRLPYSGSHYDTFTMRLVKYNYLTAKYEIGCCPAAYQMHPGSSKFCFNYGNNYQLTNARQGEITQHSAKYLVMDSVWEPTGPWWNFNLQYWTYWNQPAIHPPYINVLFVDQHVTGITVAEAGAAFRPHWPKGD